MSKYKKNKGKVYIVGAGPGDPDLLTVKARKILDNSQIVLHDSLVTDEIINSIPSSTEVVNVGKKPGGIGVTQEEINKLMVDEAKKGKTVVRLKGGDPCIFGRGGEESKVLAEHDVEFEIVPGVSSVLSPSTVGIPLTHRDHSSSITIVTGHEDPSKDKTSINWEGLSNNLNSGGTLIILMGVSRLEENTKKLIDNGVSKDTSVGILEKATWKSQRLFTGTLFDILNEDLKIESPAVIIIGEVVDVQREIKRLISSKEPFKNLDKTDIKKDTKCLKL